MVCERMKIAKRVQLSWPAYDIVGASQEKHASASANLDSRAAANLMFTRSRGDIPYRREAKELSHYFQKEHMNDLCDDHP